MAKALLGHVGGPGPRVVSDMRRLRQRVRDLEAEIVRMRKENDVLAAEAGHADRDNQQPLPALLPRSGQLGLLRDGNTGVAQPGERGGEARRVNPEGDPVIGPDAELVLLAHAQRGLPRQGT
jgi:hypothetical protein